MGKKSVSVTLENVSKIYKDEKGKDVVAVDKSDFTLKAGDLVTLLGPSGCGKTTTLRMIAGFELPSTGKIRIGEEDVTMLPPNKRDTATVFQSYGLFPHMTVSENVAYGLKIRKMPAQEIEKKVRQFLDMVGLGKQYNRASGQLSGGQQQRVALARSLIVEPSVLLLDEPLSNLDALLREQMRVEIRRIQKTLGISAVYVTHDRVEAMSLSDQVIVMKDGKIKQMGPPQEVYENPLTQFVAGFVGKVAFFPVEIQGKEDGAFRVTLNGKPLSVSRYAQDITESAVLMARPESLRLSESGEGFVEGKVKLNVYLGNSIESFVETSFGEVLIQIDDPASKKIYAEGSQVSVNFDQKRVRLLSTNKEA
ncbi:MAG: ABC transporter ATP-binding protein [Spirochaetaceae bacterium]|nr:ABC transporter ATP-binding protein [Spirochaetaceae bacterium]